MAIDDTAGRRAVREKRIRKTETDSVFVEMPRLSGAAPRGLTVLRDDVHQRGLTAARKALRAALRQKHE